jgi:glutathione synthase/RimK-type ligase-like ATP-grasp enzyme
METSTTALPPRRVALATCREFANLDPDDARLLAPLARLGVTAVPAVWDDRGVDWARFDLVVLRSTWDYTKKPAEFLAWVDRLPRVLNPPAAVRWSSDKHYLRHLIDAGLPVVPTTFVPPGGAFMPPGDSFVIKPAIGAGSKEAARYTRGQAAAAATHVARLHRAAATALVQPYLDGVDSAGESDLVFLGGEYSHAARKGSMLNGERVEGPLFFIEPIHQHEATTAERVLAERALAAVPGGADRLLYARVDLLPTADGPVVTEVELIEPSLFLGHRADAADRLAQLIAAAVE